MKNVIVCDFDQNTTYLQKEAIGGTKLVETMNYYVEPLMRLRNGKIIKARDVFYSLNFVEIPGSLDLKKYYNVFKNTITEPAMLIGGNHYLSYYPVKILSETYPKFTIISFDAHDDMRDVWDDPLMFCPNTSTYQKHNHATWLRRIIEETDNNAVVIGWRSGTKEAFAFPDRVQICFDNLPEIGTDLIYITVDADVISAEYGLPSAWECDGLSPTQLETMLETLFKTKKVIGFDLVEVMVDSHFALAYWVKLFLKMVYWFYLYQDKDNKWIFK